MLGYVIRRLLYTIPMLFVISLLSFMILHLAPGDPITAMLGPGTALSEEVHQALIEKYNFDKSILTQYMLWLGTVMRGDLGYSFSMSKSVTSMIRERFPRTFLLALSSFTLSVLVALPLGFIAATKQHTWIDQGAMLFALIGISIPNFVLAVLLILLFSVRLGWLPVMGFVSIWEEPWEGIRHLIMPAMALGSVVTAIFVRYVRAEVLDQLHRDYVVVARAKGIREYTILLKHVGRNASVALITIWVLYFARYLGGTIIIEQVFSWPGIGRLAFKAASGRDYPLLQGVILVFGVTYIVANLLTDVIYVFIDPRITYD